jgi:hypothetical protein
MGLAAIAFSFLLLGSFSSLGAAAGAEPPPWTAGNGFRSFPVVPRGSGAGFSSIPGAETGANFTNVLGERLVASNRVTENGSGVALGDIDGDGWCDIYFCGLERENALFRNLGGWKFEEITSQAGVACAGDLSTGAVFADVDGDGDLDLLVNSIGGGTRAFMNDGRGRFTERTGTRLVRRFGSTSLALADIDLDGDLDLYVANYRTKVFKDELPEPKIQARLQDGKIVVTPAGRFHGIAAPGGNAEIFELAERDFLYINDGNGFFSPVSWTNGNFLDEAGGNLTSTPLDWALSVMMRDINGDFLPDIIVCNDFFFSPDKIWLQRPGLQFQLAPLPAIRKVSLASMAVDVADINRDGHDDLIFVEMLSRDHGFRQTHRENLTKAVLNTQIADPLFRPEVPRNTVFLARGDGTYAEVAELAGLDASEWSWGALFLDVDLDGHEDLLVPTGHYHDVQDADLLQALARLPGPDSLARRIANLKRFKRLDTPILAFRNHGQLRFTESHDSWGLNIPGIVHGFAAADLDNDGDLDLVANRLNSEALLLRNDATAPRLAVRLKGSGGNTRGIGAKILVRGGSVAQQQTMICGGRYLSGDDTARVFAATGPTTVEVQWPNRTSTVFSNLPANRVYELTQDTTATLIPPKVAEEPIFAEASALLGHQDTDPKFDDFSRQPMLPYSLSSQGPGLVWYDVNGDGREDLVIGGDRGGRTHYFQNTGSGFQAIANEFTGARLPEDQMGLAVARVFGTDPVLLAALANYEGGGSHAPSVHVRGGSHHRALPGESSMPGALALSDIDGDGDLDLFVAGRVIPGRYPFAANSRFFTNNGEAFSLDVRNSAVLEKAGMITSAMFADLDDDGMSELITAAEWGQIRVWKNVDGKFEPRDYGLQPYLGLWTSLACGDFDNDGKLDIIAGNWGRNTKYSRFLRKPLRIYYGDLDGNGTSDLVEAIYHHGQRQYVSMTSLELLRQTVPALVERFGTYHDFSRAGIDALLPAGGGAQMLEVNTLDSMCFLNRGSRFEARLLPLEAQFAPIFGLAVGDFDCDGNEDVVLGQNLFDTRWETGRLDSGSPLFLRGDGRGNFETVSVLRSGLRADGQQRAVAIADFNEDGRMDVAISQNNDETKLFENRNSPPGLRLKFVGGKMNREAVGCRFQVRDGQRQSPAREIQSGGGWLTQNSFTRVVKTAPPGARLAVRWTRGREAEFVIPTGAKEVLVTETGLSRIR